jgi:hypothetical protein
MGTHQTYSCKVHSTPHINLHTPHTIYTRHTHTHTQSIVDMKECVESYDRKVEDDPPDGMSLKEIFSVSCIVVSVSGSIICVLYVGWLLRKVRGVYSARSA